MQRLRPYGFTLIELMIVVAIIGVLAVVAGTAYRRYMDSGRTAEAMSMLGEIRAKEEAYRAEFSSYAGWSTSESTSQSLPAVDNTTCTTGSSKEPCPKAIPTSNAVWTGLGINAGRNALYCGYILTSGAANVAVTGTVGSDLIKANNNGSATPGTPWWYAIAICDNDGNPSTSNGANAQFATAFDTTVVSGQYEHH